MDQRDALAVPFARFPAPVLTVAVLVSAFATPQLGYNGVGYKNTALDTPHIDALAADGLRLESYYTYKVCAPARGSFLTGRYPYKLAAAKTNFAYFWTLEGTNASYTMLPRKLQQAGYTNHMTGKWVSLCCVSLACCCDNSR